MTNLISVIGNVGSGKTLYCTRFATRLKRPIYSNYSLNLPNYEPLELFDLINLPNNVNVFIDEAYAWIDSRASNRAVNRYCSYVILQSRKTWKDFMVTAQMFSTLDLRFRKMSNIIVECKAIGSQYYNGLKVPVKFHYKILNRETKRVKHKDLYFENAIKYFGVYNTYEVIDSDDKERLEFYFIINKKGLLKKKCLSIIDIVKPHLTERFTHVSLKAEMIDQEIPLLYEPYVYDYIKGKAII